MTDNDRSPRLPWLFLLGLSVFAYALFSKWMKWPAGTPLLITSGVLTSLGALMGWWRRGEGGVARVAQPAVAALVAYVVFRLLYWPGATFVACVALGASIAAGVLWWRNDRARVRIPVALGIVLLGTVGLMAVPVHALYHYMFFETPGARRFMHSGVGHWYRYSWFLYQDGQYARSAAMIDSAMAEVDRHDARTGSDGEWLLDQLRGTRATIEARRWNAFQPLRSP